VCGAVVKTDCIVVVMMMMMMMMMTLNQIPLMAKLNINIKSLIFDICG
jgi:hypothetical protein